VRWPFGPRSLDAALVRCCPRAALLAGEGAGEYDEYFATYKSRRPERSKEIEEVIGTANRYVELVVENNKKLIELLARAWGWLDADDIELTSEHLNDVHRHNVEWEEGKRLRDFFYFREALKNAVGPPSSCVPPSSSAFGGSCARNRRNWRDSPGRQRPWSWWPVPCTWRPRPLLAPTAPRPPLTARRPPSRRR
jgi:hypothetical protein